MNENSASKLDKMSRDQLELPDVDRSLMAGQSQQTALSARHHISNRSLNTAKKREDLRRIEQENLKLARKIFEIRPSICASEQVKDWKYQKSISDGLR